MPLPPKHFLNTRYHLHFTPQEQDMPPLSGTTPTSCFREDYASYEQKTRPDSADYLLANKQK